MKNYNKTVKSDGYIKNQNIRLRNMRIAISLKMSLVAVPLTMLLVFFSVLILSTPSPEKWERSQITYSDISREYFIRHRSSYMLNTTDEGRFILPLSTKEIEELTQQLEPGKQYSIVYTKNLFTKITKSLSYGDCEFISLDDSVFEWKSERKGLFIFIVVMLFLIIVGSILIYMFWCKKEREQILKIKSKIDERLSKKTKR